LWVEYGNVGGLSAKEISFKVAVWGYCFGFSFQIWAAPALSLFVLVALWVYTNSVLCLLWLAGL